MKLFYHPRSAKDFSPAEYLPRALLWTMVIFGLLFVFLTPPMEVSDEQRHWYRIFQISRGGLFPETQSDLVGGRVPRSMVEMAQAMRPCDDCDFNFSWEKMSSAVVHFSRVSLAEKDVVFAQFVGSAVYLPVSYGPAIVGMWVARLFDLPPLMNLYLLRLASWFFSVLLLVAALRIMPFGRLPFFLLLLMPTTQWLTSSFAADGQTIGIIFLWTAYVFRCAVQPRGSLGTRQWLWIGAGMGCIALLKPGYLFVPLLALVIPLRSWVRPGRAWLVMGGCYAAGVIIQGLWSAHLTPLFVPSMQQTYVAIHNLLNRVDPAKQMDFILRDPVTFGAIFLYSAWQRRQEYALSFVGSVAWMHVVLPSVWVYMYYAALTFTAAAPDERDPQLRWWQRAVSIGIAGVTIVWIHVLLYVSFSPVGSIRIWGIAGRYFIPVAPLVFCVVGARRLALSSPGWWMRAWLAFVIACLMCAAVVTFYTYYL